MPGSPTAPASGEEATCLPTTGVPSHSALRPGLLALELQREWFMVYVRRQDVPSSGEKVPSFPGNKEGFLGKEALEWVLKPGLNLNACSEWGEGFPGSQYGREKFSQTVIRK